MQAKEICEAIYNIFLDIFAEISGKQLQFTVFASKQHFTCSQYFHGGG